MTSTHSVEAIEHTLRSLWIMHGFQVVHSVYHELLDGMLKDLKQISEGKPKAEPKPEPVPEEKKVIQFKNTIETIPEPVVQDSKTKKANHKQLVQTKQEEMKKKGIEPSTLLTLTSMKKWIDEGRTYWWISEETGASDQEVSVMAKQFGLQSNASKMIGIKKAKK